MKGYGAETLKEAKRQRTFQIRALRVCTCAWPLVRKRNRHGHDDHCPATAMLAQPALPRPRIYKGVKLYPVRHNGEIRWVSIPESGDE